MVRVKDKLVFLLAVPILLGLGAAVFAYLRHHTRTKMDLPILSTQEDVTNPHAANAQHPPQVARIMTLLPKIANTATLDEIISMLGLPKDWNGGDVSGTHCYMYWNIAPGYRFNLSFDPVFKDGNLKLVFTDAGLSAQTKAGFEPDEYHTIYPYRTWKGMVTSDEDTRLP